MKETRTHDRVPYRVKLWCYHYYTPVGEIVKFDEPIMMEVFDVSLGGIGVVTKSQFPDNATLEFTLYLEQIPYQVMTQLKWVSTNNVFFRYGLEIIGHNNMLFRHLQRFVKGESIIEA
jgi:c-di-GMP-binding flagellar brake protein YcgR